MFFGDLFQFADVDMLRKKVEMEHRFVFTVLAKESYVFAKIHVFQMIGDETSVASLNTLSKFAQRLGRRFTHNFFSILTRAAKVLEHDPAFRRFDEANENVDLFAVLYFGFDPLDRLRCVQLGGQKEMICVV